MEKFVFIVICFALRQQYFKIECFDAALDDLFEEISGQPSQTKLGQAVKYVSALLCRVKEVCWLAQIQKISSFILTQEKISAIVQHAGLLILSPWY